MHQDHGAATREPDGPSRRVVQALRWVALALLAAAACSGEGIGAHTFETQRGEVTLACAEADIEMYMFAVALGSGAPDPLAAANATMTGALVSIDTRDLTYEETEVGVVAHNPQGNTTAWVEPVQLRDGTWGVGAAAYCNN